MYVTYVRTYPSVRIIVLVSHTTYVVCVNFIHKWRDLQSTPNVRFFEKLFMATLIYFQSFCQKSAERGNRRRNTFRTLFWCLAWNPGFSSNKPTHYLLDYGDFILYYDLWKIMAINKTRIMEHGKNFSLFAQPNQ